MTDNEIWRMVTNVSIGAIFSVVLMIAIDGVSIRPFAVALGCIVLYVILGACVVFGRRVRARRKVRREASRTAKPV